MAGAAVEADCDPAAEDSSPVTELYLSLQKLRCQEGLSSQISSPCREIVLTPECISLSLNALSGERETPTVRRRRARSLSPESSSEAIRPRSLWRNSQNSPANKENERAIKRLRVRLSSRFSSDDVEEGGSWSQYRSDPEEGASHTRETDALDPVVAVRFREMTSQQEAPPTPVTRDAVADLTLIGDFSKHHLLPVERAGHQELHCVSAHTVASLIRGQFGPAVEDFLIVDCRYPYEYQGGHIRGAVNLYSESQIQQVLQQASAGAEPSVLSRTLQGHQASRPPDTLPRNEGTLPRKLIVFHCEFSSERGPHLCQYLRRLDRRVNVYPSLLYPELYLLLGGYKHFYSSYPDLCDPCGYVPMRQREFRDQLHSFHRTRAARQRRRRPIRTHTKTTVT